jgi:hypothetical protein
VAESSSFSPTHTIHWITGIWLCSSSASVLGVAAEASHPRATSVVENTTDGVQRRPQGRISLDPSRWFGGCLDPYALIEGPVDQVRRLDALPIGHNDASIQTGIVGPASADVAIRNVTRAGEPLGDQVALGER